jgi:hypothetical protein
MKEKSPEDISERPSGKMVVLVTGSIILFLALLFMNAFLENRLIGYFVFSVYLILGFVIVFRYKIIGKAIFTANYTVLPWVWRHLFRSSQEKIRQRVTEFKALPISGYAFHLGITFIIGLGLIAFSTWSFIMLYQGIFY